MINLPNELAANELILLIDPVIPFPDICKVVIFVKLNIQEGIFPCNIFCCRYVLINDEGPKI